MRSMMVLSQWTHPELKRPSVNCCFSLLWVWAETCWNRFILRLRLLQIQTVSGFVYRSSVRLTQEADWARAAWSCWLDVDGGSRGGCRCGDGVSGRGQVKQGADGPGHLGEPSLLQDVQRKTQLTLQRQTPQRKNTAGQKKTTEMRVNGWKIKPTEKIRVTMVTQEKWGDINWKEKREAMEEKNRWDTHRITERGSDRHTESSCFTLFIHVEAPHTRLHLHHPHSSSL